MQVIQVHGRPESNQVPLVLAIGKFDGIHIGHQAILSTAKRYADNAQLAVMTFHPHPTWVLSGKEAYRRLLTPLDEKCRVLEEHGVRWLYQVLFTKTYANTTAETFVHEHLGALRLERVVVGEDFRFGQGGQADTNTLMELCATIGVPVSVVRAVEENGTKVSSSQIRLHLENGRVEAVEALLGRPYAVVGTVIHGNALGRTIGFPTANLGDIDEFVLPRTGVYAVSVEIDGSDKRGHQNWFGVMNAGYRPTVNGSDYRLEVHLLGFDGDLYGQRLRVSLLRRVRDERRFGSLEELKAQIHQDVSQVKDMLGLTRR
jgi:riboflavin kinase / FMN adenylyltransferase